MTVPAPGGIGAGAAAASLEPPMSTWQVRPSDRATWPAKKLVSPMKPATKRVAGPFVEVFGRADLLDAAVR